jgi:multidrug efflux pump subunit AcrB
VIRSVVTPLEEQINGVEDMSYMKSTASNDGTFTISVIFKQGECRSGCSKRSEQSTAGHTDFPQEVVRMGLTTSKQQNSMVLIFNIYTEDNKQYDETFLQNYANINLIPQIKRVKGVGQAQIFGIKDYSMRIWLNPQKMSSYGLEPADVSNAIADHSLESAPESWEKNPMQLWNT